MMSTTWAVVISMASLTGLHLSHCSGVWKSKDLMPTLMVSGSPWLHTHSLLDPVFSDGLFHVCVYLASPPFLIAIKTLEDWIIRTPTS